MRSSSLTVMQAYMLAAGLTGLPLLSRRLLPSTDRAAGHRRARRHARGAAAAAARRAGSERAASARRRRRGVRWSGRARSAAFPAYTIGNAVSVVTGEELRAQQVRNAAEACAACPASPSAAAAASATSPRCASAAPRATTRWS